MKAYVDEIRSVLILTVPQVWGVKFLTLLIRMKLDTLTRQSILYCGAAKGVSGVQ